MLAPGRNYVNSPIQLSLNIETALGVDVDPDTVTFKTFSPSGLETSYVYGTDSEVTKSSVGNYDAVFTPNESGRWYYRWETTGTGTTIGIEGQFLVQASAFFDDVRLNSAYRLW